MVNWLFLPDAIAAQWGEIADCACSETEGRVTSWRHPTLPEPTKTELETAIAQFMLQQARSEALAVLSAACQAEITAGVISSALGAEHLYGSDEKDQANLLGAIALTLEPIPYTCTEVATGEKAMRNHTRSQLQTLLQDAAFRRIRLQQRYEALRVVIEQATTLETIAAVRW